MKDYKWCAIDAEGDVGNLGLRGVAIYSDIMQEYITDHEDIKQALYDHADQGYTFLAHNAQYDLSVIFWQLDIPMKAVYYNGRFNHAEWKFRPDRKLCHLWDTLALSGGLSLDRLGRAIGYPKYATPQRLLGIDPNRFGWFCSEHDKGECESCYAIRDAEIAYRFVTELQKTLAAWGVEIHHRLSGLAVAVWRQLDNPSDIRLQSPVIAKLARRAYHGGRVETFKLGHLWGLYTADICSMYPYIMQSSPYPDPDYMVHIVNGKIQHTDWSYEGVADVDITIPYMHVPPLPYVMHNQILYPCGRLRGAWTFAEIRYALSLGATINRVFEVAYSTRNIYPFTNFINTLWAMREAYEKSHDPRALFAKLLMNNLYGRLGMKGAMTRKDIYPQDPNTSIHNQPHNSWYTEDKRLYLENTRRMYFGQDWTNVLWAASTTAYARLRLHGYLLQQSGNLAYCDTDSVFSTQPIIGLGSGLGRLRDEQQYAEAIIIAPKLYALRKSDGGWVGKAKGIKSSVAMDYIRTGHAEFTQPIKPTSQARRKIPAGTWVTVQKDHAPTAHRRQPVSPESLFDEYGSSETVPPLIPPRP